MRAAEIAFLFILLLAAAFPARAVICSSFTDEAKCNKTITSSGGCMWVNGECQYDPDKLLPAGMVGIASISPVDFGPEAENQPR